MIGIADEGNRSHQIGIYMGVALPSTSTYTYFCRPTPELEVRTPFPANIAVLSLLLSCRIYPPPVPAIDSRRGRPSPPGLPLAYVTSCAACVPRLNRRSLAAQSPKRKHSKLPYPNMIVTYHTTGCEGRSPTGRRSPLPLVRPRPSSLAKKQKTPANFQGYLEVIYPHKRITGTLAEAGSRETKQGYRFLSV